MDDFAAKRNALFACLDNASKDLKGTALDQSRTNQRTISALSGLHTQEMNYRRGGVRKPPEIADTSLSHLRGTESLFKKPQMPIAKCLKPRRTPDYQINPHKWKKYSLADVDISDHTNTSAAFNFLKQMDEQRDDVDLAAAEELDNSNEACASNGGAFTKKIEFKKSSKIRRKLNAIDMEEVPDAVADMPIMRGSKILMPEYVIGQKKEKKRKPVARVQAQERAAGSLALSHLQEEDVDDEEITEER